MSNKLSLSVILPIKSSKVKDFEEYFDKAITSINSQTVEIEELVIVHSSEESLVNFLNDYNFGTLNVVKLLWDKKLMRGLFVMIYGTDLIGLTIPAHKLLVWHGLNACKTSWYSTHPCLFGNASELSKLPAVDVAKKQP